MEYFYCNELQLIIYKKKSPKYFVNYVLPYKVN